MTIHTAEELADAADARAEGDRRSQDRASMIVYDDERDLVRPVTEAEAYVMGAHAALGWVTTTGGQP